ncbi:hypothetical protein [Kitasatospora sp. NPDC002965]|uniref:hypothetical protein n=1 Tax=Kitasatospora sp. NPDC002965 TaxID=3154775 RepID=UPI0033BF8892
MQTTATATPTATDFDTAVREHTPSTVPTDPWGSPCCASCSYTHGGPVPWPCRPLIQVAKVAPTHTGWQITMRTA